MGPWAGNDLSSTNPLTDMGTMSTYPSGWYPAEKGKVISNHSATKGTSSVGIYTTTRPPGHLQTLPITSIAWEGRTAPGSGANLSLDKVAQKAPYKL